MATKQARYSENMKQMNYSRVSVWLGEDTRARLDRLCQSAGLSKGDVIASALFLLETQK